jgi:hypothetical protein
MRRTVVFFPDDPSVRDCNISVVITNVSVEFTKLGSFGNIDSFATNLVNGLDRSYLLRAKIPSAEPVQVTPMQYPLKSFHFSLITRLPCRPSNLCALLTSPVFPPSSSSSWTQIAKLVDYRSTGDVYSVEYTVQKLPGPQRHLYSACILGSNGR